MAGIFPNAAQGGIAPGIAVPPGYDPVNDPVGTLALYFSENCGVRLTPEVLNAIISQISAAIDRVGLSYDPSKGGVDLSDAIQYYIQKNMGAYLELSDGPLHYTALGAPTFIEYKQGMVVWARMPPGSNNVQFADLSVDGLPFRPIVRSDGSSVVTDDMLAGRIVEMVYHNDQWQLFNTDSDFMTLARQRLPIFPDVRTPTGRLGVVSPGTGSVVIPNGVGFLHRGIFLDNTDNYTAPQKTFATAAGKTYHLRWTPIGGFALRDLSDGTYNPGVLPEADLSFDTKYDDMLIARVVTNGANVATVTDLVNQDRLWARDFKIGAGSGPSPNYGYTFTATATVNWGRRPKVFPIFGYGSGNGGTVEQTVAVYSVSSTRYGVTATADINFLESGLLPTGVTLGMTYDMSA